jgi:hypothetical protein
VGPAQAGFGPKSSLEGQVRDPSLVTRHTGAVEGHSIAEAHRGRYGTQLSIAQHNTACPTGIGEGWHSRVLAHRGMRRAQHSTAQHSMAPHRAALLSGIHTHCPATQHGKVFHYLVIHT